MDTRLLYKLEEEVMALRRIISCLSIDLYAPFVASKTGNQSHEEQSSVNG
jgi:hypothetical protein